MGYLKSVFVTFAAAIKVIYRGFKIRQRLPGLPPAIINYGHAHVSFFENFGQLFTSLPYCYRDKAKHHHVYSMVKATITNGNLIFQTKPVLS